MDWRLLSHLGAARRTTLAAAAAALSSVLASSALAEPSREDAAAALRKAVRFFHSEVASHGGYVWVYGSDLVHRHGEGIADEDTIWIQPPGTPAVGLAFLEAYGATGDPAALRAARDAARALVEGQLHSGGWHYHVTFDPEKRRRFAYRRPPTRGAPRVREDPAAPGGWDVWRQRRHKENMTLLDDDTTQSALRLLMQVDRALDFEDEAIHEAAEYGLRSLLAAQYPIGAWSHNYDRFPRRTPDPEYYPVLEASYPASWSRAWTKDFTGCYMLNDRITLDALRTLLDAHEVYGEPQYLEAALRAGDFLLRSRMPEPQPAWAQQYDRRMHPVWDRKFEPPAISGLESQDTLETLLLLHERTGKRRYLEAVRPALRYLERSRLPDGKLARFYELRTNRPIYFTKDYRITYDQGEMPDHYAFVVDSRLDAIARRYRELAKGGPDAPARRADRKELAARAEEAIRTQGARGEWTEPGWVRDRSGRKVHPPGGVIRSETFIERVRALSRFLGEGKTEPKR